MGVKETEQCSLCCLCQNRWKIDFYPDTLIDIACWRCWHVQTVEMITSSQKNMSDGFFIALDKKWHPRSVGNDNLHVTFSKCLLPGCRDIKMFVTHLLGQNVCYQNVCYPFVQNVCYPFVQNVCCPFLTQLPWHPPIAFVWSTWKD